MCGQSTTLNEQVDVVATAVTAKRDNELAYIKKQDKKQVYRSGRSGGGVILLNGHTPHIYIRTAATSTLAVYASVGSANYQSRELL